MIGSELYNSLGTMIEGDYANDYEIMIEIPDGLGTRESIDRCYLDPTARQIVLVLD